jgi:predicted enzyme related to lactoylglutathione lyase
MSNPVVHWEFWTRQLDEVAEFYANAFDWKIQTIPEMNYSMIATGGMDGGMFVPDEGPLPGNMALYLGCDDLEAAVARVREAGGTILVEEKVIPGQGRMALFADPEGRVNGLWEHAASDDAPGDA